VPLDAENRVLRRVTDFEVGEAFRLRVADGEVEAVTRSTKSHGSE
jgi:exonuclease VII large subunit